jgi:hypothetical protein
MVPFNDGFVLILINNYKIIYINSVSLSVCDEGFGGWGKGEAGEVAGNFFS